MQVQIKRVVVIDAVDETHCRHTITGEVKVRVVGVGKLVEKYVMQNTISALELLDSVVARCASLSELWQACIVRISLVGVHCSADFGGPHMHKPCWNAGFLHFQKPACTHWVCTCQGALQLAI